MIDQNNTVEKQYRSFMAEFLHRGANQLGPISSYELRHDPKYLSFKLSRYKFVSKMLSGRKSVLEVGCGDGFGSQIIRSEVERLICVDIDPLFIGYCEKYMSEFDIDFRVMDFTQKYLVEKVDGIYSMDVLEHISPDDEHSFMKNILLSLKEHGVVIIGIPSLESQIYTAEHNKIGHVNCKSGDDFKKMLHKYFHNVFLFSSNDEVIHTGYLKMAHYLIAICCEAKQF